MNAEEGMIFLVVCMFSCLFAFMFISSWGRTKEFTELFVGAFFALIVCLCMVVIVS